ncbi:MAG: MFS transporter [Spirochaetae bacterium HGW-Spirochaetae-8]|jgi:MFS family permease|nr:MAG: MFS transporter [Spirochaetae bacterium HGW-Spirochaetae-8]
MKPEKSKTFIRDVQYYKFCAYGFLKDLRFYEPFLMLFFLEKGLTYFQIGGLYAVREIFINLMEIPSGVFADALGRKRTMIISFLAYIVSFTGFYLASDYWMLLVAMFLYAFGDAFRTGTHKAMIFDYLQLKGWLHLKTHYYGHTRSWSQRGAALSALIAAALVFRQGSYAPVFLFTIIPYVLDMLLIASYPKSLNGPRTNSARTVMEEFKHVLAALITSFKRPQAFRAIANQAVYSGYYKACKDYLQPILKSLAVGLPVFLSLAGEERTAILTGLVYFSLYLLTSLASRKSGVFADRFNNLETPLNGTLLAGVGIGLLSGLALLLELPLLAVLLYIGIYVIENLRKPMGIAYVSERMDKAALASSLSVESQAETLFSAVIALLLGFFSNLLGLGLGIFVVSGICIVLAFILRLPRNDASAVVI